MRNDGINYFQNHLLHFIICYYLMFSYKFPVFFYYLKFSNKCNIK